MHNVHGSGKAGVCSCICVYVKQLPVPYEQRQLIRAVVK